MLLLLNEHEDPSLFFSNSDYYYKTINRQSLTKILMQVLFQWNDLRRCKWTVSRGYWPSVRSRWMDIGQFFSLFCDFMDRDGVEVHILAKKERGQYPAIVTEQTWSIKDLLYGFRGNFSCGTLQVIPSLHDSSILPARVINHSAGFDSFCSLTELAM